LGTDYRRGIPRRLGEFTFNRFRIVEILGNNPTTKTPGEINVMQMKKFDYAITHTAVALTLFMLIGTIFCGPGYASEKPRPGNQYKIVQPVFLIAAYNSLNDRQVGKETARAYLSSKPNAKRAWMAFQCEVPVGTIMTIIGPGPKVWYLPFSAYRYFVRLDPDLSRGLDVELELNRGIEGSLDGLNPELFSRQ
jgi:hypothetical protein